MRLCLCVCLLALLSLDEVTSKRVKNTFSREPDEDHRPVKDIMDIINTDEENEEGSGVIPIEGSGTPPSVTGSGDQEILVLDIRVTALEGITAVFDNKLLDNSTPFFKATAAKVCNGVLTVVSNDNDIECKVIEFYEGSIIAKTELTILPSSAATPKDLESQIKAAAKKGAVGELTVDPKSIVVKSPDSNVQMTSTPMVSKEIEVVKFTPTMKVKPSTTNEFSFASDGTQETTRDIVNVETTPIPEVNFFDRLFKSPVMLAGMVGAAVLVLLTMILLGMFIVYRVKKKDEGSYSLDEPGKMKDPQAYWKDTKEFYA
ncbi:syndecan-3-like [Anneissia japonica]|uniref:syndecan-3-like n=1 Tax=Anneissia japonica TaxID=1529436 RepID=UPI00142560D6|nr:syndecan-3-like [Anneissia japonica]